MKKIELFQVKYSNDVALDNNAVIIDFPSNEHQGMFENYHILQLPTYISNNNVEAEYVGIISERLKEKTGFDSTELIDKATEQLTDKDDAFVYYTANVIMPALGCIHTNIPKILIALAKAGKIDYKALLQWQPCMANYWLLNTDKVQDFVDYMQAVVDEMESNETIQELLTPTVQYREQEYPMKVFVLEYLFGVWCAERRVRVKLLK